MLSMVASIFEMRAGMAMPETVAEVYDQATKAMLQREPSWDTRTPVCGAVFHWMYVFGGAPWVAW